MNTEDFNVHSSFVSASSIVHSKIMRHNSFINHLGIPDAKYMLFNSQNSEEAQGKLYTISPILVSVIYDLTHFLNFFFMLKVNQYFILIVPDTKRGNVICCFISPKKLYPLKRLFLLFPLIECCGKRGNSFLYSLSQGYC